MEIREIIVGPHRHWKVKITRNTIVLQGSPPFYLCERLVNDFPPSNLHSCPRYLHDQFFVTLIPTNKWLKPRSQPVEKIRLRIKIYFQGQGPLLIIGIHYIDKAR